MQVSPNRSVVDRPKQVRRRFGLPKVRTGCKTCKRRHIKCDEMKPSCQRCTKLGIECDGYDEKKPAVVIKKPAQRELRPKGCKATKDSNTGDSLPPIPAPIAYNPGGSPEDLQYFQYFQQVSVNELSGGWHEPLWNTYLLQACHEMPFIQDMALALAAQGRFERLKHGIHPFETAHQRRIYAMKKYSKSLAEIRRYLASASQPDVRMFLLVSLLIYIFEFKQGNMETAVRQVRSTLALFKNMRSIKSSVYVYNHHVRCPETLEDVIVDMVARLDKQGFLLQAKQPSTKAERIPDVSVLGMSHQNPESTDVPADFPNVFVARRYISFIQYWGRPNFASDAVKHILRHVQKVQGKTVDGPDSGRIVSAREFSNRFLETKQWLTGIEKLFQRLQTLPSSDYRCALSVKIQGLATLLVMACGIGFRLEARTNIALQEVHTKYGSVRGLCEEMLRLGRMAVDDPAFLRCYVFDFGIIVCILVILFATNDPDLEKQTVKILRDMRPRKEGVWDSCVVTVMAETIVRSRSTMQML
ncbi:hypothetical protein DL95DRAFT_528088 [Leptodontidium sp. 2 PMI_412]|nr:hypothetical protein DL95DRAFT_528088 [Leptodontidium sp. 2 PMI_412]